MKHIARLLQTVKHWMYGRPLVKNLLKDTENTFLRDDRGELTWP